MSDVTDSSLPVRTAGKANAVGDDGVDESATLPAERKANAEASSASEQDAHSRRDVQQSRPLTADEKCLAKLVRSGLSAEQVKLIKEVPILLGGEKAQRLEAQSLRDLEEYVTNGIREKPSRAPLRQVKETLFNWTQDRQLPTVPIAAITVFLYAHNLFVGQKAVWNRELRISLLKVLEELRHVANKGYEKCFQGMSQYRKAFLDPILDTPESRALVTVDRDLGSDRDVADDGSAGNESELSSGEEIAQQLTAASPNLRTQRASGSGSTLSAANGTSDTPKNERRRKASEAMPGSPNRRKRNKTQTETDKDKEPTAVTAENATTITDASLAQALGHRKSSSKAALLPLPSSSLQVLPSGPAVHPTSPLELLRGPAFATGGLKTKPDVFSRIGGPLQMTQRTVIDLSRDSSDDEHLLAHAPAPTKPTETVGQSITAGAAGSRDNAPYSSDRVHSRAQLESGQPFRLSTGVPIDRESSQPATVHTRTLLDRQEDLQAGGDLLAAAGSVKGFTAANDTSLSRSEQSTGSRQAPASLFNKAMQAGEAGTTLHSLSAPASPREELTPDPPNRMQASQTEHDHSGALLLQTGQKANTAKDPPNGDVSCNTPRQDKDETGRAYVQSDTTEVLRHTAPLNPSRVAVRRSHSVEQTSTSFPDASTAFEPPQPPLPIEPIVDNAANPKENGRQILPTANAGATHAIPNATASQSYFINGDSPVYDQWDVTFLELEQAVFRQLEKVDLDYEKTTAQYVKDTVPDKQTSALFGWQRNTRRAERLRTLAFPQLAAVTTVDLSQQIRDGPNATQGSVQALLPPRAVTLAQWQMMSLDQQREILFAQLRRTKPRYPDFLRAIRTPAVATRLGPVYLGSATPADILGDCNTDRLMASRGNLNVQSSRSTAPSDPASMGRNKFPETVSNPTSAWRNVHMERSLADPRDTSSRQTGQYPQLSRQALHQQDPLVQPPLQPVQFSSAYPTIPVASPVGDLGQRQQSESMLDDSRFAGHVAIASTRADLQSPGSPSIVSIAEQEKKTPASSTSPAITHDPIRIAQTSQNNPQQRVASVARHDQVASSYPLISQQPMPRSEYQTQHPSAYYAYPHQQPQLHHSQQQQQQQPIMFQGGDRNLPGRCQNGMVWSAPTNVEGFVQPQALILQSQDRPRQTYPPDTMAHPLRTDQRATQTNSHWSTMPRLAYGTEQAQAYGQFEHQVPQQSQGLQLRSLPDQEHQWHLRQASTSTGSYFGSGQRNENYSVQLDSNQAYASSLGRLGRNHPRVSEASARTASTLANDISDSYALSSARQISDERQLSASFPRTGGGGRGGLSAELDRVLATQEILEDHAKLAAEKGDIGHIAAQCTVLLRAGLSESDVDYFKRRALLLMNKRMGGG